MKCERCGGLMVDDRYDHNNKELHCFQCGRRGNAMGRRKKIETGKESLFKIEKGIPIPPKLMPCMYPFTQMAVGDSFFLPDLKQANKCRGARTRFQKRNGDEIDFIIRAIGDGCARCWRTK